MDQKPSGASSVCEEQKPGLIPGNSCTLEQACQIRKSILEKIRGKIIRVNDRCFRVLNLGFRKTDYKEIEFDLIGVADQSTDPAFQIVGKVTQPEGSRCAHMNISYTELTSYVKVA
jgi:hypothetical protein